MAKTWAEFYDTAKKTKELVNKLREVRLLAVALDAHHTKHDFSDAATGPPAYVNVDSNGDIKGLAFTPQEYLDCITAIRQLEKYFTNQAVTQGDYLSSVEKVADA